MHNTQVIHAIPSPFQTAAMRYEMPVGLTVAEMLAVVAPLEVWTAQGLVFVDDRMIPAEEWSRLRPRADAIISVKLRPTGGGDDKNPLRTLLTIAVVVASFVVPGMAANAMQFYGAASGFMEAAGFWMATAAGSALTAGAIYTAGMLAVNALVPPMMPKMPGISGSGALESESPTYSIAGARNTLRPWGVIPRVLGRHRMAPPYGAQPYTELAGDDVYMRFLFVWGYGPLALSDFHIGDTNLAEFKHIEIEHRFGHDADTPLTLYPSTVDEQPLSILLEAAPTDEWTTLAGIPQGHYPSRLIETTAGTLVAATARGRIYRSTNSGATWAQVHAYSPTDTNRVQAHLFELSSNLYAAIGSGAAIHLFRSADDGATWEDITPDYAIIQAPLPLSGPLVGFFVLKLYSSDPVKYYTYNPATEAMSAVGAINITSGVSAAIETSAGSLLAFTGSGIYRSTNSGVTWTQASTATDAFSKAAPLQTASGKILFPVQGSLYESTDDGATWTATTIGASFNHYGLARYSTSIYCGTSDGLYRSTDDGDTWTQQAGFGSAAAIHIHATATDLYAIVDRSGTNSYIQYKSTAVNVRTTPADVDEICVDVAFPQGLFAVDSTTGAKSERTVEYEVLYAPTGTTDWSVGAAGTAVAADTLASDDLTTTDYYERGLQARQYTRKVLRYDAVVVNKKTGAMAIVKGDERVINDIVGYMSSGTPWPGDPVNEYYWDDGEGAGSWKIEALGTMPHPAVDLDTYWLLAYIQRAGTSTVDPVITAANIRDARRYDFPASASEFIVTATSPASTSVDVSGGTLYSRHIVTEMKQAPFRRSVRFKVATGQYDVKVTRVTADTATDLVYDKIAWVALRTFKNEDPVGLSGLAKTALRIKATDQLNGVIDEFTGVAESILPDWDVDSATWIERPTRNPAAMIRTIFQDAANARPLADARLDLDSIQAFAEDCINRGVQFDHVVDYRTSVIEIAQRVATAGRAQLTMIDSTWGVWMDRLQDTPVQMFTPRNSWGFSGERVFNELPHAFRMRFQNSLLDYEPDEVFAYRDGYDAASATLIESLEITGITKPDILWREGRYHMAVAQLRREKFALYADFEHLVCTRGDLVRVIHDVPKWGLGSGRIKSLTTSGSNITHLSLDETVTMAGGTNYCIRARLADMSLQYHTVVTAAGSTATLQLTTPVPVATGPAVGDLVAFGVAASETVELIVRDIEPGPDLTARLVCVDAAPDIYDVDKLPLEVDYTEINITTDTVEIANDYDDDDIVIVETDDTLPGGLDTETEYYIVNSTATTFQLALTSGGAAVNITSQGAGTHTFLIQIPDYNPRMSRTPSETAPEIESIVSDESVLHREPDGSLSTRMVLTFSRVSDRNLMAISHIECQLYRIPSAARILFLFGDSALDRFTPDHTYMIPADARTFVTSDVEDGEYYLVTCRYVYNGTGHKGPFTRSAIHKVVGKTRPPATPTSITATGIVSGVRLAWTAPDVLDYQATKVWRATADTWPGGDPVATLPGRPGTVHTWSDRSGSYGTTYYYWVKSVDTSGNESAVSASVNASPQQVAFGTDITGGGSDANQVGNNGYISNVVGFSAGTTSFTSTNIGLHSGANAQFLLGHATDYSLAKIGLKNDGSGKLASGNISWDVDGNVSIDDATLSVTSYAALPGDENLVAYWSLDDGTGTVAVDNSGNGQNGTLMNGPTWGEGKAGQALTFVQDSGHYVSIPDDCLTLAADWSISMWVAPTSGAASVNTRQLAICNTGGDKMIVMLVYEQRPSAAFNISSVDKLCQGAVGSAASFDTWTHIVVTYTHSTQLLDIYSNTSEIAYDNDNTSGFTYTQPSLSGIGVLQGTVASANGQIDEVRLYDKVLLASEIKALYLTPSGNKSTQISGDQIRTGKIVSTDATTYFDLDNKALVMGGKSTYATTTAGIFAGDDSGTYKLNIGDATNWVKWSGTGLDIKGTITITGGNGIASLSDAGALAVLDQVTATEINVTQLSSINANMGSLTSGSIVIGSTNKIWLNDSADGALNIGGSVKASAPFNVTAAGALTATGVDISGAVTASSGSFTGAVNASSGAFTGYVTAGTCRFGAGVQSGKNGLWYDSNNYWYQTDGIKAQTGTIGGFTLSSDLLKSAASGARIELSQAKHRISVFDATQETVAMGFLDGLAKHDGSGNWGSGDYGFWARTSDKLVIDGDAEYQSGDWIVKNDGDLKILDGSSVERLRLGTDGTTRGLHLYSAASALLASYGDTGLQIYDGGELLMRGGATTQAILRIKSNAAPAYIKFESSTTTTDYWRANVGTDGGTLNLFPQIATGGIDKNLNIGTSAKVIDVTSIYTEDFIVSNVTNNYIGVGGADWGNLHVDQNSVYINYDGSLAGVPLRVFSSSYSQLSLEYDLSNKTSFSVSATGGLTINPTGAVCDIIGSVGIASTSINPAKKLEIIDSSAAQLRLTHTAGTYYADMQATSSGDFTIDPSSNYGYIEIAGTSGSVADSAMIRFRNTGGGTSANYPYIHGTDSTLYFKNSTGASILSLTSSLVNAVKPVRYQAQSGSVGTLADGTHASWVINGKYVIGYNDGGTMKYRYLTLTSTNATWTYTTTEPT